MISQLVMVAKASVLLFLAVQGFAWMVQKEVARWAKGAPLMILIGLFAIGMLGQTVWVPFAALLFVLSIFSKSRPDAAALFIIAAVALPALRLNVAVGGVYLMPFDKWFFLSIGLAIAVIGKPKLVSLESHRFDLPIIILIGLSVVSIHESSVTAFARALADGILPIALTYYFISRSLNSQGDVQRFTLALGMAGFVMACVALVESKTHWLIYQQIDPSLHIQSGLSGYLKLRGGLLRAPASFPESTSLGVFLAFAFTAIYASRPSFKTTGRWAGALLVIMLGILAANTRGAFVAVAIAVLAFDFYRRRYAAAASKVAAALALFACAVVASPYSHYAASLVGRSADTQSTSDYRRTLLTRGMEEIRKHPYFGQSMPTAMINLADLKQGEGIIDLVNGYVSFGLTAGYPGMLALFLVFALPCLAMLLARSRLSRDPATLSIGGFVFSVSAFMIVACFTGGFGGHNSMFFYAVLALGSAIWALRGRLVPASAGTVSAVQMPVGAPNLPPIGGRRGVSTKIESPAGIAYRKRQSRIEKEASNAS